MSNSSGLRTNWTTLYVIHICYVVGPLSPPPPPPLVQAPHVQHMGTTASGNEEGTTIADKLFLKEAVLSPLAACLKECEDDCSGGGGTWPSWWHSIISSKSSRWLWPWSYCCGTFTSAFSVPHIKAAGGGGRSRRQAMNGIGEAAAGRPHEQSCCDRCCYTFGCGEMCL